MQPRRGTSNSRSGETSPRTGEPVGIVFQAITSISLGVMTARMLYDMVHGDDRGRHGRHNREAADDDLGPAVRREVERAQAEHRARQQGRGG